MNIRRETVDDAFFIGEDVGIRFSPQFADGTPVSDLGVRAWSYRVKKSDIRCLQVKTAANTCRASASEAGLRTRLTMTDERVLANRNGLQHADDGIPHVVDLRTSRLDREHRRERDQRREQRVLDQVLAGLVPHERAQSIDQIHFWFLPRVAFSTRHVSLRNSIARSIAPSLDRAGQGNGCANHGVSGTLDRSKPCRDRRLGALQTSRRVCCADARRAAEAVAKIKPETHICRVRD